MGAAGSDVAINSASIALMNDDLGRIPFLVDVSRKTRRVIDENLAFGVLFIVLGISLSKFVRPEIAAFLHFASSLVVVFNSARLFRQGEELDATASAMYREGQESPRREDRALGAKGAHEPQTA
jgi:Cd2+/Zn2+-exporting ATPase